MINITVYGRQSQELFLEMFFEKLDYRIDSHLDNLPLE